jgi:hypothetical protein
VRAAFHLEVRGQHLLDVLADLELAQVLQVGQPVEEEDALDQAIGMLHLLDRLVVFDVGDLLQAPLLVHAGMEEILVDRRELARELRVQELDDLPVAFHAASIECQRRFYARRFQNTCV